MTEKYYSVRETMDILKRSRMTIYAYIRAGLLKAQKLKPGAPNSKMLIKESDLNNFINNALDEDGNAPRGYYQEIYPRPHKGETK